MWIIICCRCSKTSFSPLSSLSLSLSLARPPNPNSPAVQLSCSACVYSLLEFLLSGLTSVFTSSSVVTLNSSSSPSCMSLFVVVFVFCLLRFSFSCWGCVSALCMSLAGHRGEDREGEDAEERRTLVVLVAWEREQLQNGTHKHTRAHTQPHIHTQIQQSRNHVGVFHTCLVSFRILRL